MQARLIKGIQKPRPEFETVGACLIMLHGISDAGANFECWYVEFLGHQEQHLEFIDAAAAHMSKVSYQRHSHPRIPRNS